MAKQAPAAKANARTPAIPGWQWAQLQLLSAQGELSGVPAEDMGAVAQAEEPADQKVGVNSEGYGGFFGTSASETPGGRATLYSGSTAAFDAEARTASGIFASMLAQFRGNQVEAEQGYQLGGGAASTYASSPGEGARIFEDLGIGGTAAKGSESAGSLFGSSPGTGSYSAPAYGTGPGSSSDQAAAGATAPASSSAWSQLGTRGGLLLLGGAIVLIAINALAHNDLDNAHQLLVSGAPQVADQSATAAAATGSGAVRAHQFLLAEPRAARRAEPAPGTARSAAGDIAGAAEVAG